MNPIQTLASNPRVGRLATVAILLFAAALAVFAQSAQPPAFQVASIKRNTDTAFRGMGVRALPGGRLVTQNAPVMMLIQNAYTVQAYQVVGGAAWINSEGYDIEAKPGGNTDPQRIWLMWQTLLADRFKLRLHRETRELPIYDLTVAKSGPKLPAAKEAGCVSFPPGTPPHYVPGKVDCGYVSGPFSGYEAGLLHIKGSKVHMADLIRELTSILDRPVLDKTGFTGEFDLDLSFTRDGALMGLPPGYGGPADPNLPNIFAALEEQLGLKLAPAKGKVEVLVIDHAERPTTN